MNEVPTCWFCHRPILSGERAHRSPLGKIAVHADCLRHDALVEGLLPGHEDIPTAA